MTMSKITSHPSPPMIHALAAMIGSVSSFLLFYPFERLRVEIQTRSNIEGEPNKDEYEDKHEKTKNSYECNSKNPVHNHNDSKRNPKSSSLNGTSNEKKKTLTELLIILHRKNQLYYGVSSFTWTIAISNFIFFYTHEAVKSILPFQENNFAIKTFLASTIAASINVILTNPLWVANMRIINAANKNQDPDNRGGHNKNDQERRTGPLLLFHYIQSIAKSEGVMQLWNGTMTSLFLICNPVIQKFVYDILRNKILLYRLLRQKQVTKPVVLKPVEAFLLGAVSKAVSTILTYPLQLAQVLLRMQKNNRNLTMENNHTNGNHPSKSHTSSNVNHYSGTVDCLTKLHSSGGVRAIFRGVNAKLLQTVLTSAFTFLTYEQIIAVLLKGYMTANRGMCKT